MTLTILMRSKILFDISCFLLQNIPHPQEIAGLAITHHKIILIIKHNKNTLNSLTLGIRLGTCISEIMMRGHRMHSDHLNLLVKYYAYITFPM